MSEGYIPPSKGFMSQPLVDIDGSLGIQDHMNALIDNAQAKQWYMVQVYGMASVESQGKYVGFDLVTIEHKWLARGNREHIEGFFSDQFKIAHPSAPIGAVIYFPVMTSDLDGSESIDLGSVMYGRKEAFRVE